MDIGSGGQRDYVETMVALFIAKNNKTKLHDVRLIRQRLLFLGLVVHVASHNSNTYDDVVFWVCWMKIKTHIVWLIAQ